MDSKKTHSEIFVDYSLRNISNVDLYKFDLRNVNKIKDGDTLHIHCASEIALTFIVKKENDDFYNLLLELDGNVEYEIDENNNLLICYSDYLYLLNFILLKDLILLIDLELVNYFNLYFRKGENLMLNGKLKDYNIEQYHIIESILIQMGYFSSVGMPKTYEDNLCNLFIYRESLK